MIDYSLIHRSISFYTSRGYSRIETPWMVTQPINDLTRPDGAIRFDVADGSEEKALVASGEQSFLYLIAKGNIPPGSYQTVTPCTRADPISDIHVRYFMKNELIVFGESPSALKGALTKVIDDARSFFSNEIGSSDRIEVSSTGVDSFDILYNDVELGSYGIRENKLTRWVYGTGLAEPRFSRLMTYFNRDSHA